MRLALLLCIFTLSISAWGKRQRYCQIRADMVPVTIGKSKTPENTLFYLERGDFYYCDPDEKATPIQEQPLEGVYRYDRPGAIYAHTEVPQNSTSHFFDRPQEVFLEGDPGQVISVLSHPGKTWRDVRADQNKPDDDPDKVVGKAWPIVANSDHRIFVLGVDYRWATDEYGKRVLVKSAEVAVVKNNPQSIKDFFDGEWSRTDSLMKTQQTGIRFGWIDQKYLRSTEIPREYWEGNQEQCTTCEDLDTDTLTEQTEEVAGPIQQFAKEQIVDHLRKNGCFEKRRDTRPNSSLEIGNITEGMKKFLRRHPAPGDAAITQNTEMTQDQLDRIRMLAYNSWGEMRSCPSRYQKAVMRIAMNRANSLKENGTVSNINTCTPPRGQSRSSYFPNSSLAVNLACVLGRPSQFDTWNGDDPNYDRMKCVKEDDREWKHALELAYDAVMHERQFNWETRSLANVNFYSSAVVNPGLIEINQRFSLPDGPLDSKKCMRFWRHP